MCKCMANTTLAYIYSSSGCPVCTCQESRPEMAVDACLQEKSVGPCRARIPRYYFNSITQKCKQFHYGGKIKQSFFRIKAEFFKIKKYFFN